MACPRADKFIATYKFKWNNSTAPGFLARWFSPGDYLAIAIPASDRKARLYKRENDGTLSTLVSSSTAITLTNNTWYTAKVVIDDDGSGGQQLRFWVDTDGDGDFADETTLIDTAAGGAARQRGCILRPKLDR